MKTLYADKPSNYDTIKKVRLAQNLVLKPCPYIRDTVKLRNYQIAGALHFLLLNRMILADSVGLGKTVSALTGYAYLKQKDPELKLIVACPKSAMDQWQEEINKFTVGITSHVLDNTYGKVKDQEIYGWPKELRKKGYKVDTLTGFDARQAQYRTVKEDILIVGYYAIQEDYKFLIENRSPSYNALFDECFEYHTPVTLEDGSTEFIGKIVTSKKKIKVLSYNVDTKKIEPKTVVNFFRNKCDKWVHVKYKRGRVNALICTENHVFLTKTGRVEAGNLKTGDIVYTIEKKYTDIQKQVVLGTILGDGCVRYPERFVKGVDTGICFMQSSKKLNYFLFKSNILSDHIARTSSQTEGWSKVPVWYGYTETNGHISDFLRSLKPVSDKFRRSVNRDLLDALDPLGIAIWYCDNGSIAVRSTKSGSRANITLHTQAFSKEENDIIQSYFKERWGINFKFLIDKRRKNPLYYLYANTEDSMLFLSIINDYIPMCMSYKSIENKCGFFWDTYNQEVLSYTTLYATVLSVSEKKFSDNTHSSSRFNIEVEDNHNYFAKGVLVSNCQELKNTKALRHLGAEKISQSAKCVYGLSATVIKNRLDEAYNIYRIIVPGLFGGTTSFYRDYCVRKAEKISRHGGRVRKIMKIVGYKNLTKFREKLDPFFLMRKTRDVAAELPQLSSKKVVLEMTEVQSRLYKQALNGDIYRREIKRKFFEYQEYMESGADLTDRDQQKFAILQKRYNESVTEIGLQNSKMAALSYCQLVSNGPGWLRGEEGESSKEVEFRRLFEQELFSEKVIVFTRFKSGIPRLEKILNELNLKHTRITGDEDKNQRKVARLSFSDMEQDINSIFITQAGSAALNLQAANVVLFYDTPWSYGDLYQTIGRAQRIGSLYSHIHLIHMVNKKTIDEHVLKVLFDKKDLITDVIGDYAEGTLEFGENDSVVFKDDESSVDALFSSVFNSAA